MVHSNELLICLVGKYPWLYNKNHASYKDAVQRANSWEEIARLLGPEQYGKTISAEVASKRWGQLRDRYRKIRNDQASKRLASGAGRSDAAKKQVVWQHYPALDVLLHNHVGVRRRGGDNFNIHGPVAESVELLDIDSILSVDFSDAPTLVEEHSETDSQVTVFESHTSPVEDMAEVMAAPPSRAGPSGLQPPAEDGRRQSSPLPAGATDQETARAGQSGQKPSDAGMAGPVPQRPSSVNTPRSTKRRHVPAQHETWQEDIINMMKDRQVVKDAHDAFGTVVADAFRRMDPAKVQAARMKVLEVLMQAERDD